MRCKVEAQDEGTEYNKTKKDAADADADSAAAAAAAESDHWVN